MRAGVHADRLGPSLIAADRVWLLTSDDIDWDPQVALAPLEGRGRVVTRTADMLAQMLDAARPGDHVVFMSNGGFDQSPSASLLRALEAADAALNCRCFPLNLVLVPGAYLPLRIFEQRYLDMVRDAARDGTGFGVCLVTDAGQPRAGAAQHARVGTAARDSRFLYPR